jgi:hypothetical protein
VILVFAFLLFCFLLSQFGLTSRGMSMNHNDRCPCGSGKPQAACCGEKARTRQNVRLVVMCSLCVIVGLAITALGLSITSGDDPETTGQVTAGSAATGTPLSTGAPAIANPQPWQYDPLTNKHWHQDHGHWHDGPPPADRGASTSPLTTSTTTTVPPVQAVPIPPPATAGATPNIPNPQPWQYDPVTNKHWHQGHGHWHNGEPPPPDQRDG